MIKINRSNCLRLVKTSAKMYLLLYLFLEGRRKLDV